MAIHHRALSWGILGILILIGLTPSGQSSPLPVAEWQKSFGGTSNDVLFSIQPIPMDGYLLCGYSGSPAASGTKTSPLRGGQDYWIIRIDSEGEALWEETFGGESDDLLSAGLRTADGRFILGGTSLSSTNGNKTSENLGLRDYWIVRLEENGTKIWDRSFGGTSSDYLQSIVETDDHDFLLAGYSFSAASGNKTAPPRGLLDYWAVRIDPTGERVWDKSFGGSGQDYLSSIAKTTNGGFILAGYSFSNMDGNKSSPAWGGADYWIVAIDASGTKLWDKSFGGTQDDYLQSILAIEGGGFLLAGYSLSDVSGTKTSPSRGKADFWVIKIDGNGTKVWENVFGGEGNDNLWSVASGDQQEFLLGGWSDSISGIFKSSETYGKSDYWIVSIDKDGHQLWDQSYGGTEDEVILSLNQIAAKEIVLGGYSYSDSGEGKSAMAYGQSDFWMIKLAAGSATAPQLSFSNVSNPYDISQGFRFTLHGEIDRQYVVEYSTDLQAWIPFATNILTGTEVDVIDPQASHHPPRFYRAVLP